MILDKEQQFSDSQALSGAGAVVSTNVLDSKIARDLFGGEPLTVLINVEVAADLADGNETYVFELQMDTVEGFGSATSVVSRTIAKEILTAGSLHTIPVPLELDVEQFLRINYTLGGTTPSITVSAHLVPRSHVANQRDYASGFTVAQ